MISAFSMAFVGKHYKALPLNYSYSLAVVTVKLSFGKNVMFDNFPNPNPSNFSGYNRSYVFSLKIAIKLCTTLLI